MSLQEYDVGVCKCICVQMCSNIPKSINRDVASFSTLRIKLLNLTGCSEPPQSVMVCPPLLLVGDKRKLKSPKSLRAGGQQHITPSERGMKKGCRLLIFRFYPLPLLASCEGVPVSGVGSPRGFVLAPAAAARLTAVVAGAQGQVAAHAGRDKGQRHQSQPAQTELLV